MTFIESIYEKLRRHPKRIVFPEGTEPRVLQAAAKFRDLGLGIPILLGGREDIQQLAAALRLSLHRIAVIEPETSPELDSFCQHLEMIDRNRNLGFRHPRSIMLKPNYYAAMMTNFGQADGLVGGSSTVSSKLLRPLIQLVRFQPEVKSISACTIHVMRDTRYGDNGTLFFADTAVIPQPTVEQLAAIALHTGQLCRHLTGHRPRIAMLSFSTKGSSQHPAAERMAAATALARQQITARNLEMDIDGELQADAALVFGLAEKKAASSTVAGSANVIVFPDLNSANIASKLVRHLADGDAYGQIVLGVSNPAGELSRGVEVDGIVALAALVGLQAIQYRKLYENAPEALPEFTETKA